MKRRNFLLGLALAPLTPTIVPDEPLDDAIMVYRLVRSPERNIVGHFKCKMKYDAGIVYTPYIPNSILSEITPTNSDKIS